MPAPNAVATGNRLLAMLGRAEYRRLQPDLERIELHAGAVLYAPGDPVRYVYFPDDAIASLLYAVDSDRLVEVAMEGKEAAVGFAIHLGGTRSCNRCVVREAGTAMRLRVQALASRASPRGRLTGLLDKSVHALVMQIAQSGVCSRFHGVDARVARWLSMTGDRVGLRTIRATQESIAHMLGVRRSSVTAAAADLQRRSLIGYRRGRIEILDRSRLRDASCACYGIIERHYDSFLD